MAQTLEQRFEVYWKRHSSYNANPYSTKAEDEAIDAGLKEAAKRAFIFATNHCGRIAEAFWNHNRFGENFTITDVWQTILGTHPNSEISVGDLGDKNAKGKR